MDLDVIANLLEHAIASLELDATLHPWWLGESRPRRAARLSRLLASPCPLGPNVSELEPRLLEAFLPEDRETVARQVDHGYEHLIVLSDEAQAPVDEASVVHVQLGLPLIGRDRVLLRLCTRNLYRDLDTATADYHAWLDPSGSLSNVLSPPQEALASFWPRWVVGRSPGLKAPVDVNTATENELLNLAGINLATARTILATRPFTSVDQLADAIGAETLRVIRNLIAV